MHICNIKYITNMHLWTILFTLIQIKINEKGYILTRTTKKNVTFLKS